MTSHEFARLCCRRNSERRRSLCENILRYFRFSPQNCRSIICTEKNNCKLCQKVKNYIAYFIECPCSSGSIRVKALPVGTRSDPCSQKGKQMTFLSSSSPVSAFPASCSLNPKNLCFAQVPENKWSFSPDPLINRYLYLLKLLDMDY